MEEIRAAACESPDVGGVLFGTHEDDSIRILTWRPVPRERDEGLGLGLVRLLLAAKQDTDLQPLQPVGWFLTH